MATRTLPPAASTPATHPSPFPPALIQVLEQVEANVWSSIYGHATAEEATACGLHCTELGSATLMAAADIDVLFFNRVIGIGMAEPASEALLDALTMRYAALGVRRFFVQLSPAALPAALVDWLPQRGFRHHNNWVKLFRGVDNILEAMTDLRIEPIGPAQADTFAQIATLCFDWPDAVQPWLARLVGQPGWRHYLAFDGDTPAAVAALYVEGEHGYLGPAATHPAYRQRGAQGALIAQRLRDAAGLGCKLLVTETAEDRPDHASPSFRNMIRFGFQVAYKRPNYLLEVI